MLLQATSDYSVHFIDAEVGFSGRTHDAFMLSDLNICALLDARTYVPRSLTITLQGVTVPALIIGDCAYQLWLAS